VVVHGLPGHGQPVTDLSVGQSLDQQLEHVELPRRQPGDVRTRCAPRNPRDAARPQLRSDELRRPGRFETVQDPQRLSGRDLVSGRQRLGTQVGSASAPPLLRRLGPLPRHHLPEGLGDLVGHRVLTAGAPEPVGQPAGQEGVAAHLQGLGQRTARHLPCLIELPGQQQQLGAGLGDRDRHRYVRG
jgi:hypothetical protein